MGFIVVKRFIVEGMYLWWWDLLWRGDLSPMGRAAAPRLILKQSGPAAQSIGDKSPRHKWISVNRKFPTRSSHSFTTIQG
jgi:hypothetical protein